MKPDGRDENTRNFKLCFCCLSEELQARPCSLKRTFGENGCLKKTQSTASKRQESSTGKSKWTVIQGSCFKADARSGSLQVVAVQLSIGADYVDTLLLCDTGSISFSFSEKDIRTQLSSEGMLGVAGIDDSKDMAGESASAEVFAKNQDQIVKFNVCPRKYPGNRRYEGSRTKKNGSFECSSKQSSLFERRESYY